MKRYLHLALALVLALLMPLGGIGLNLLHCRHSGQVWVLTEGESLQQVHCQLQQPQDEAPEEPQIGLPPCMDLHQFRLDVTAMPYSDVLHLKAPVGLSLPCWMEQVLCCRLLPAADALSRGGGTTLPHPLPARERLAHICILRI